MAERHDTVIIGGGQAGLAMSYFLREQGREHVVVERRRLAERAMFGPYYCDYVNACDELAITPLSQNEIVVLIYEWLVVEGIGISADPYGLCGTSIESP